MYYTFIQIWNNLNSQVLTRLVARYKSIPKYHEWRNQFLSNFKRQCYRIHRNPHPTKIDQMPKRIMKWSVTLGVNENIPHVTFKIRILKVEEKQTSKGMLTSNFRCIWFCKKRHAKQGKILSSWNRQW